MRYRVTYGYRTDDGLNYCKPTAWAVVEVEADSEISARLAAIDAAYAAGGSVSHVHPTAVEPVGED